MISRKIKICINTIYKFEINDKIITDREDIVHETRKNIKSSNETKNDQIYILFRKQLFEK